MSSQGSNKDQITLELSPKDINSKLNEPQVQQYPSLSLNAQNTILSNLSEDIIDTIPLSSQKQKILQKHHDKINTKKSIQYCKSHNKPFQVICIEDGCKICTNCAIFGQHKGHHFKSEEDFKRDIGKYLEDINKIVDKKINLQSDNIKQRLKKVSSIKKTQLINTIEKKVNNLRLIIDKLEIQSKKQVTNLIFNIQDTTEKAIKKISDKLSLQYNDWEAQSSKYIETLGSNQLKQQINIVYSQNQQSHTIKGDKIFQKYNNKTLQLFQDYKEQISLVRADINSEIDSILTKAIHVTNKIQLPLLPLPVLSHYISNGQQKLLVEEPQKHEMILNIQSPKESESAISYQNKSDRFNNTSFSSLNIPKLSESFVVGQKIFMIFHLDQITKRRLLLILNV